MSAIKLHLGCGTHRLSGWINTDSDVACAPDRVVNVESGLPYSANSVSFVYSEDMIALIGLHSTMHLFREVHRVLVPGGVFRVLTPDLRKTVATYLEDPAALRRAWDNYIGLPLQMGTAGEILNEALRLCGTFHYDSETLLEIGERLGFMGLSVSFRASEHEALRNLDIRDPDSTMSMYHEFTKP